MAWIRYNPNPAHKETVYCVVRAIHSDLDEALKSAKDDHTRMLIMRAMEKLDSSK